MNKKTKPHNILLILTGGTICSFLADNGERVSDTERAKTVIVDNFRRGESPLRDEATVVFDTKSPIDVLSENMTPDAWNVLLTETRSYDYSKYDGVIVLHGTDTLAYTSALLSIVLAGIGIPVMLVSSQLPVWQDGANGNANFRVAVELIVGKIEPNIYAVYRNSEEENGEIKDRMYLHYAAHLCQCAKRSNNFYSADMMEIDEFSPKCSGCASSGEPILYRSLVLSDCVLNIEPYVGINYDRYMLDGVRAVLHGTYHSSTVAADPYSEGGKDGRSSPYSILALKKRCDAAEPPIPVFIEPCDESAYAYETTGIALRNGVGAISKMTSEMAYIKLLVGCSLGLEGESLVAFLESEINREFVE